MGIESTIAAIPKLDQWMFCAKFSFKLMCGSGEEDENVNTLQTNEQIDGWTDGLKRGEREKKRVRERKSEREQKWTTRDSRERHNEK